MTALLENPATALHEIVLRLAQDPRAYRSGKAITVACTCTASWPGHGGRPRYEPIEARTRFPASEVLAAWRAWHHARGVIV